MIAVCLHPQSDGTAGWGTATFAEPNEAARAVRAACVEVEVADADGGAPRARTLPLQRATLAMESRALAADAPRASGSAVSSAPSWQPLVRRPDSVHRRVYQLSAFSWICLDLF